MNHSLENMIAFTPFWLVVAICVDILIETPIWIYKKVRAL